MTAPIDRARLAGGLRTALDRLLAEQNAHGYWTGELSPSALSTATALSALCVVDSSHHAALIERGLAWLRTHQNDDGGWGDTPDSPSNLSTTLLAAAALALAEQETGSPARVAAQAYVVRTAGPSTDQQIEALATTYGKDRTFAAPILTDCAIAGLVDWDRVPPLPFEWAALPHAAYRLLRLQVVSYALPALIAVGLARHRKRPTRSPLLRLVRALAERPTLRKLEAIQPPGGGFLEATPLTSFVAMSLAAAERRDHPVTNRCVDFLVRSARPDGSWPIDSNLSVWVTTNAVIALAAAGALKRVDVARTAEWLAARALRERHPYTNVAPGGWAWTHLPGGVPDADDTARALTALNLVGPASENPHAGVMHAGADWLIRLQNRDGGWPTFCRGWGKLPFDRSAPDLTAHVLEALYSLSPADRRKDAATRGLEYLRSAQRPDGSWLPLWFGNQAAPDQAAPVLGTASVLPALFQLGDRAAAERGTAFLVASQNADGGWGGCRHLASTTEETAVVVSALARSPGDLGATPAALRGAAYLLGRIDDGSWLEPSPIGLYFAKLWYSERLYPIIWVTDALGRMGGKEFGQPDD